MRDYRPVRRSLTHVGGEVDLGGAPTEAAKLGHALDVQPVSPPRAGGVPPVADSEGEGRAHVHGFHAYPARMHPVTAARLIEAFVPAGGTVLDPFCGSGTVLVEALERGRSAIGTDLNPLAVALSMLKTTPREPGAVDAMVTAAKAVAALAEKRRKEKAGATQRYPDVDTEAFAPHVLLELDGLRHGIYTTTEGGIQSDLLLVLSSILVKLSTRESDTSSLEAPKRIAAGYPSRLFVKKADELAGRLRELEGKIPKPRPSVVVQEDDALDLRSVEDASVDAVVSSPPYVATYDYLAHHALRLRWLDLDARAFEAGELGSRREYTGLSPNEAWDRWATELHALLRSLARVTKPGGAVVLLMADSAVGREALPAEEIVADAARQTPLICVSRASQARPHFHQATRDAFASRPRAEHALLLRRS